MPSGPGEPLPPEEFRSLLRRGLTDFSAELTESEQIRLARFLTELDGWRRRVNLTGKLSAEELVSHALESAIGAPLLPEAGTGVDVGTGGGFPGVPLAIRRPELSWRWLEPREKRAAFLRHVARVVPVENAIVQAGRSEELPEAAFDFATSRAVGIPSLGAMRFLRAGGALLLWSTRTEAFATPPAGFQREQVLEIPRSRERVIVLFRRG